MQITKIEQQKKNKDRFSVFIDGAYSFSVYDETLYKYKLKTNTIVTPELLHEILHVEEQKRANSYALTVLSRNPKTEKQLLAKLIEKEFEEEIALKALDFAKSYGYIDDSRYAESFIKDNLHLAKLGKNKIKSKLFAKGIPSDIIQEQLNLIVDEDQQYESALELGSKKYATLKNIEPRKANQKLTSFLQYRGYSFDIIKKVIYELQSDSDSYYTE